MCRIWGVLIAAVVLLTGCMAPGAAEETAPAALLTPTLEQAVEALPASPTPDPALPAVLLQQAAGAGTLSLVRYSGPQGTCVALTFDPQTFPVNRCGTFSGPGIGFVDSLTDPAGGAVRVAYGLALDPNISAVAVEFAGGGNTNTAVQNGAYLLVLGGGQMPQQAIAINQFGNLVGRWPFH